MNSGSRTARCSRSRGRPCATAPRPAAPADSVKLPPQGREKMKRVTGVGGIFIKSANPDALRAWYQKHLGIPVQSWGGAAFQWAGPDNPGGQGTTVWNVFEGSSQYFDPSRAPFMVNYRVDDLRALIAA